MRTIAVLLALAVSTGCDPAPDADAGVDASAPEDAHVGEGTPADTYFALAVTDDSRNHTGDRLLFLDFADRVRGTFDTTERGNRVVQAPFVEGTITVDGDDGDWDGVPVTRVDARPQSNYVLSEHYDAVPITIEVSAAYDDERVYLRARWEDPGHAASVRHREWTFDEASGSWAPAPVAPLAPGAPNASVPNASDALSGVEDQDRLMVMFPVRDPEGWFADGGLGCAGLCHGNLALSGDPATSRVGNAAVMNAGLGDALFDAWEWQAALTAPSGHADDLRFGPAPLATLSGIAPDEGDAPFEENREGDGPALMHPDGFSQGPALARAEGVPLAGTPSDGDTIPAFLSRAPSGSRADVLAGARYDEPSRTWTVELSRARETGNDDDRAFAGGAPAPPPSDPTRELGDARSGAGQFSSVCSRCHGSEGQGVFGDSGWEYPRVQRASSSLVHAALERVMVMQGLPIDEQGVEDVAAFLRALHTPAP